MYLNQSHLFINNNLQSVLDKGCLFYMAAALHVFEKTSIQTIFFLYKLSNLT